MSFIRAIVVFLGLMVFQVPAMATEEPCTDAVFVAGVDLSAVPAENVMYWSPGRRYHLTLRLEKELEPYLAPDFRADKAAIRKLTRLVDLYFAADRTIHHPHNDNRSIVKLGFRRINAHSNERNDDADSDGADYKATLIPNVNYILEVRTEIAYLVMVKRLESGTLANCLPGWGFYKVRFLFLSSS